MIRKLPSTFVEKVWGIERLPPPFPQPSNDRIGEVWFEPPPVLDQLLVKHIFASERLSVQAHPDDAQAQAMNVGTSGKSECWVILNAEPGATIAAGFREEFSPEAMREAALDGSIIDMLIWHEVCARDAFYIPAGTVHAIGGGVSLIEVQQNCDITFRLFDYGRPRELHLDQAMQVARIGPYPAEFRSRMDGDTGVLVDGPHFRLQYWRCGGSSALPMVEDGPALLIPFSGKVSIRDEKLALGECAVVSNFDAGPVTGDCLLLIAQPTSRT
ncbi:class I mannose-6-phosphate isomerase [Erythrobacter sp.]|uniref:class I mannose-6-phosphate isomerase n=1 Tax=Erythrobacter sp. TaxID=1042 RepID=UPI001B08385D|nr:class I mannose-6-phosphate isomerase [Erythrobacter sp.]MBO6526332.1 class I mannose-6-phosphate isomerase [Erythrobacter sp.]MBO6530585.1 class I mannose-6-phosphate isomerase [Erythrobacter sp.]